MTDFNAGTNQVTAFTPEDIESSKVMAGLAYILFFLPLVVCPDSPFGRYHANQGLLLLLLGMGGSVVLSIIPIIGGALATFTGVFILGFGLINGFTGKGKALPIIGKSVD